MVTGSWTAPAQADARTALAADGGAGVERRCLTGGRERLGRAAPQREVSGFDREGKERTTVTSMERLETLGGDPGAHGAVSDGNGAKRVGSRGTWKGHRGMWERTSECGRGNGTGYVFRRQRVGRVTEWYLGARNYTLGSGVVFGAGKHVVVGAKLYVRVRNSGRPKGIWKGRSIWDQGGIWGQSGTRCLECPTLPRGRELRSRPTKAVRRR